MSIAAPAVELPDDPAQLKALLRAERALRTELAEEVARLEAIVAAFKRAMFGGARSSSTRGSWSVPIRRGPHSGPRLSRAGSIG
jgi:hypothetical protein